MAVLLILLMIIQASNSWRVPDCEKEGCFLQVNLSYLAMLFYTIEILVTSQPRDVEVFEEVHNMAKFPCYYEGGRSRQTHLQWIINSTVYDSQLPPDHQYLHSTHTLSVTNIKQWQNSTTYQCQVLVTFDKGQQCVFRSTIGQIIIKGNCFYNSESNLGI